MIANALSLIIVRNVVFFSIIALANVMNVAGKSETVFAVSYVIHSLVNATAALALVLEDLEVVEEVALVPTPEVVEVEAEVMEAETKVLKLQNLYKLENKPLRTRQNIV